MTMIDMTDPHQRDYFRASQAKGAIKLHKVGIRANRHIGIYGWMNIASALTGANLRARDADGAIAALEKRMAVLLVYMNNG